MVCLKYYCRPQQCVSVSLRYLSRWAELKKKQFIRRLTHFNLNVVFKNRGVINPLGNLTAYVYKAFFSIRFFSYPLYDWSDILLISPSERSSNLLYFSHSRVAPSTRASEIAAFVRSASPYLPAVARCRPLSPAVARCRPSNSPRVRESGFRNLWHFCL